MLLYQESQARHEVGPHCQDGCFFGREAEIEKHIAGRSGYAHVIVVHDSTPYPLVTPRKDSSRDIVHSYLDRRLSSAKIFRIHATD